MLKKAGVEGMKAQNPLSRHSSNFLDLWSDCRKDQKAYHWADSLWDARSAITTTKLSKLYLAFSSKITVVREFKQFYIEAISSEKRKRKRNNVFAEEFKAEQVCTALLFWLSKAITARELVAAEEAVVDELVLDRLLKAQDRAERIAERDLEAQQKHADRCSLYQGQKAHIWGQERARRFSRNLQSLWMSW